MKGFLGGIGIVMFIMGFLLWFFFISWLYGIISFLGLCLMAYCYFVPEKKKTILVSGFRPTV